MEPTRPPLRLVTEETPPTEAAVNIPESAPTVIQSEVSKESTNLTKYVESLDAEVPLIAGFLVCEGIYLADAAIAFYHSGVSHAPSNTFRHDIPPGLKSAEATRAWLGSHLSSVKELANASESETSYVRGKDLKAAVSLAGTELDRALGVTKVAGLYFTDRHTGLFKDATASLEKVEAFLSGRPTAIVKVEEEEIDTYIHGMTILAGCLA